MRLAIARLALALWAQTVFAQPSRGADDFSDLATTIASNPSMAGQWVVLLPVIARQCGMTIEQDRVTAVVNAFDSPDVVDGAADYYAAGPESRLGEAWETIVKRDRGDACRLADGLWGKAGRQFPNVLRDP